MKIASIAFIALITFTGAACAATEPSYIHKWKNIKPRPSLFTLYIGGEYKVPIMPYGSYRYDGEYLCWFYTKFDGDNGRVDTIFSGITAIYSIEGGENCRPRSIDGFAELYAPAFRLSVGNSSGVQFSDEAPCNGLLGCEIYAKYRSNGKIYIAKCDFPDPEVPRRSDDTCTVVVENVFGVSEISLIFPHSNKISNREVARRRIAQAAKWIDVIQSSYVRLAR